MIKSEQSMTDLGGEAGRWWKARVQSSSHRFTLAKHRASIASFEIRILSHFPSSKQRHSVSVLREHLLVGLASGESTPELSLKYAW
jgi:hypothetical protein